MAFKNSFILLQMDRLQLTAIYCNRRGDVKITPQMTRFRDAKVCSNLATNEIDDHRIQSDFNMNCNIQKEKNSTLGIAYAW